MAITYSLAINPKWYIADLVGKPLAGGYLATFSNLDPTQVKLIFQDPAGQFPWPYIAIPNTNITGVLFDENGSQGPFYWEFDSNNPNQLYYIEVYDRNGVLQWTVDDFSPPSGGGGSVITTALDLENLVANNVMYRNFGSSPNPITSTSFTIAPGANTGFAATLSLAGPDITFNKNNLTATDQLQFIDFTLGTTPFTGDVTPEQYLRYTCTNTPSGETFKYVQFPITSGVQNLTNQQVTLTIWARVNSGANTLNLQWMQFFGDGSAASAAVTTTIQSLTLTSGWNKFQVTANVPSVLGKNLGQCGNSGLFLQVQYPLGAACSIDFTKPAIYLGDVAPDQDYHTYDMIDGLINTPRTGDTRFAVNNFAPFGWIAMNDGTIGSASSSATARANIDTFPLYNMIWNGVTDTYAPVTGGRGASAIADFSANKPMALTRALGRVFAGTLNTEIQTNFTTNIGVSNTQFIVSSSAGYFTGVPIILNGGPLPGGFAGNVVYYAILVDSTHIALASTYLNALANTALTFSSDGSGNIQVTPYTLGQTNGEDKHVMTVGELVPHTHPPLSPNTAITMTGAGGGLFNSGGNMGGAASTGSTGGGQAFNVIQPTTYMNVFIKL
jgi:hypothetical protein